MSATCLSLKRLGRDDFGLDLALLGGNQRTIGFDHAFDGEKSAVLGNKLEEIERRAVDSGTFGDRHQGADLVLGREHRRAHQALQIG